MEPSLYVSPIEADDPVRPETDLALILTQLDRIMAKQAETLAVLQTIIDVLVRSGTPLPPEEAFERSPRNVRAGPLN